MINGVPAVYTKTDNKWLAEPKHVIWLVLAAAGIIFFWHRRM